jgi:hypothetical protein
MQCCRGFTPHKDTTDDNNCMIMVVFEPDETKPLVYLHTALFESMRLYPHLPGSIERKEALAGDVLPGQQWIPR